MKVYGPYTRRDGRQHVILYESRKRRTVSYPKYIMQQIHGKELGPDETVDHIDEDKYNNSPLNLQILTRKENATKSAVYRHHEFFICPVCAKTFSKPGSQYRNNQLRQNKAGPFCSRKCAGRYNASRQYGTYEFDNT